MTGVVLGSKIAGSGCFGLLLVCFVSRRPARGLDLRKPFGTPGIASHRIAGLSVHHHLVP